MGTIRFITALLLTLFVSVMPSMLPMAWLILAIVFACTARYIPRY